MGKPLKETAANPHSGHRSRVRSKVAQLGLEGMPEHEVLEYLLFHTIPRGDVNALAHALIDRFGSFAGVLDASSRDLCGVDGVGETTALFLSSLPSVFRLYRQSKQSRTRYRSLKDLEADLTEEVYLRVVDRRVETLVMACLSNSNTLLSVQTVSTGTVNAVNLPFREVVNIALSVGAVRILLAHNHPEGDAMPSRDDIRVTQELMDILKPLGIELLDHIIVGAQLPDGRKYLSMRESALIGLWNS